MFTPLPLPGQPPQRPPSLAPTPGLGGGPFRAPYPAYGLPPRNVLQGYPGLPTHRTVQNLAPQPSPNFLQQRNQGAFPFGGGLGAPQTQQQQPTQSQTQQQQPASLQHPLPTPQSNTATSNLPPHLTQQQQQQQNPASSSLAPGAPSVSSASEVGLDPNDFPALGSGPTSTATNTNTSSSNNANPSTTTAATTTSGASYASQAGTGVGLGGSGAVPVAGGLSGSNQTRDFTPDDFPALGVQSQSSQQQQTSQTGQPDGHPPGLNGFHSASEQQQQQQHRQALLGSLTGGLGGQQQQPGLLNLGGQSRNLLPGFQSEAEKQRNYTMKLNQASHPAWSSSNPNGGGAAGAFPSATTLANGAHSTQNHIQQPQPQQQPQSLAAPPGVPPPPSFANQQQQTQPTSFLNNGNGNGTATGDTNTHPSQGPTNALPQTPAQQILLSPADRWGLLGLIAMIKNADLDQSLLSVGTDLGTMGLDMQNPGNLYSTFITPWADSSAAHTVEPDFHLPPCYNVHPPPPGPNKAAAFSDETLFFMFYSSPRDAMQEVAAQELWNRNWRYHKELRLWITKETGTAPSQKVPGGEQGTYTYWDPDNWEKGRKEMTVMYADLEEKSQPVFAPGLTLQIASAGVNPPQAQPAQATQQQQPQPTQAQQAQAQALQAPRAGGFQGMAVATAAAM
ncbi:hypothetical protein JAAARDRAFT_189448 [Jaapia argillacea MUCL 33604]|uniref:NOT2/NOT3/NOT5 C-terminal domain-containing protein n=1 Tax=Jaapia argillacea MUCL 33604 TaxID=933084 RepID=A0A067Q521_9AGAM|nr:hypothetical protein JAAARDRAFT_189448 [Jaapia argillacea MUCL 33604]